MAMISNACKYCSTSYIRDRTRNLLIDPRRIKQFSNVFVPKKPIKNANFVWKMGFVRFVLSTTVHHATQKTSDASVLSSNDSVRAGGFQLG